jgi:hypothetical protein
MTANRRKGPRRRHDALLFTALAASAIAMGLSLAWTYTTLHNRATILHVQDGRRVGVIATCGINRAIILAGRQSIESGTLLPGDRLVNGHFVAGPLTRQLGPSYPSYPTRVMLSQMAADRYEKRIVDAIVDTLRQEGVTRAPVTRGHIDCREFLKASKVSDT